jgi:hypothetical protein
MNYVWTGAPEATDRTYVDYFWKDVESEIIHCDEKWYYIEPNKWLTSYIQAYDFATGTSANVHQISARWSAGWSSYWQIASKLARHKDRLYYNTPDKIYSVKFDGTDNREFLSETLSGTDAIYEMKIQDDYLYYRIVPQSQGAVVEQKQVLIEKTVHGYVWPMINEDWGIGDWFLRAHDVTVELRPTYNSAATVGTTTEWVYNAVSRPALASFIASRGTTGLGEFTLENVPFGEYVLAIKRPGYLVRCINITISATDPDTIELTPPGIDDRGVFQLWGGDCNDDWIIDNSDIGLIVSLMEQEIYALSPGYRPSCDMNADGLIDNSDIGIVTDNWNKSVLDYPGAAGVDFFS